MGLFQFLQTPTWDYKKMDQSLLLLSNRKKVTNTLKGGVGSKVNMSLTGFCGVTFSIFSELSINSVFTSMCPFE